MSHIEVIALRSFPWSENGYTEIQAVEKSTFMLPDGLFDGLNKAGYVRRAEIGDGHISLEPPAEQSPSEAAPAKAPVVEATAVTETEVIGPESVSTKAPQPPVRTAELSDEESAALLDGTWKDWRFFKQRSVAAKISDTAILNGDDAKAAIEAYLAKE